MQDDVALVFAELVNLDNVFMPEPRCRFCFGLEAFAQRRVMLVREDGLDCDYTAKGFIDHLVNTAHAAVTQLRANNKVPDSLADKIHSHKTP